MVNSSNAQELKQKFQEVLSDEAFAKELLQMEDVSDVQKALDEKGIDLSLDDIRRIRERTIKARNGEDLGSMPDGELSEDELMEVAGGENPPENNNDWEELILGIFQGAW